MKAAIILAVALLAPPSSSPTAIRPDGAVPATVAAGSRIVPAGIATPALPEGPAPARGDMLLTIFLRHDQSKTLGEINAMLRQQHFYERFPPPGTQVVSWYDMMGIGQVVTLRFPAEHLRDVNKAIEETAWGAYRTEFYPTYDYKPIAESERRGPPPGR